MKTNIRTLAAICILVFIGAINVNGANYRNFNNKLVVEEVKNTKTELSIADLSLMGSTEKPSMGSNAKVEFLMNEDLDANIDLQKEAQAVTRWIIDQEEAKVFKMLLEEGRSIKVKTVQSLLNENADAKVDLHNEARLVTKLVVDQEEAKIVKKLIDEGKLEGIN